MVRDAETGEMLSDSQLWELGYAVGLLLRPKADLLDTLDGEPSEGDMASLTDGYETGIRETEAELELRKNRPAPLPVCDDELPY